MLGGFLDQSQFLQAIGLGILNSLWQTLLLWGLYKAIVAGNQHFPSSFRYQLSLLCLAGSLVWFIITVGNQYSELTNKQVILFDFSLMNHGLFAVLNRDVFPLLSLTYLLLLAVYAVQFCRQYFLLYNFRNQHLTKAPVDIRLFSKQAAFRIGIKKEVTCWLSAKVDAPFVTGFFKPVILLPFSLLNHLTTAQAEAVILHELTHVKRNDYLVNIFQLIAEKLLFFNPFARLLSEAARVEREHCCDDAVVQYRFNQYEYAHALLQVEQLRSQTLLLAMQATNGKKRLLDRIKRIVSTKPLAVSQGQQKCRFIISAIGIATATVFLVPAGKPLAPAPALVTAVYTASRELPSITPQPLIAPVISTITDEAVQQRKTVSHNVTKASSISGRDAFLKTDVETSASLLINEALLAAPDDAIATAIPAANQQMTPAKKIMVRVEEEVAGSGVKKVYYVQLDNDNGQVAMTPIAMIKQPVKDSVKIQTTPAKKTDHTRKRVAVYKPQAI